MVVSNFDDYCSINERLEPRVTRDYRNIAKRFLKHSNGVISTETIRSYLSGYLNKAPKTYNNQLDGLRAFIARYLKRSDLMEGFRKAHVSNNHDVELPNKRQLKKGFEALGDDRERAVYLFYATTGLRRSELLRLNRFEDIDYIFDDILKRLNEKTLQSCELIWCRDRKNCKYR